MLTIDLFIYVSKKNSAISCYDQQAHIYLFLL